MKISKKWLFGFTETQIEQKFQKIQNFNRIYKILSAFKNKIVVFENIYAYLRKNLKFKL